MKDELRQAQLPDGATGRRGDGGTRSLSLSKGATGRLGDPVPEIRSRSLLKRCFLLHLSLLFWLL